MHSLEIIYSCLITNDRIIKAETYNVVDTDDVRVEQLLTTLKTTNVIQSIKQHLYISFSNELSQYQDVTRQLLNKIEIHGPFHSRLERYSDWRSISDDLEADCVLLMSNHDHAFLFADDNLFKEYIEFIAQQPIGCIGSVTHWPEYLSTEKLTLTDFKIGGLPVMAKVTNETIGTVLVRRETFQSWFAVDFTGGSKFVRPDNPFGPSVILNKEKMYVPPFEFFRHLDGYEHIGITSTYSSNLAPTVYISSDREILESAWSEDLSKGQTRFNPKQLGVPLKGNTKSERKVMATLVKKSWGKGVYPKNFNLLLSESRISNRVLIAGMVMGDTNFVISLIKSRLHWNKKKGIYKLRLFASKLKIKSNRKVRNTIKFILSHISNLLIREVQISILTAASESHVASLHQLLSSIEEFIPRCNVTVYDLGISPISRSNIESQFTKMKFENYNFANLNYFEQMSFLNGCFVWKPKIIKMGITKSSKYLIWMDAGNLVQGNLKSICLLSKILKIVGFTTHESISDLTHPSSLRKLGVLNEIEQSRQVSAAGIVFYRCRFARFFVDQWVNLAIDKDVICPDGADRNNHRFDQSIFSVLINTDKIRRNALLGLTKLGFNNEFFGFKVHQDID